MTRQFRWEQPSGNKAFSGSIHWLLVCTTDPKPCAENPLGCQIVAEIIFLRERFGRQGYCYKARVYWDRGDDGSGHFPIGGTLPNGSSQDTGYPNSWAIVGNSRAAKRWAEAWLGRWLWQWDDCVIVAA